MDADHARTGAELDTIERDARRLEVANFPELSFVEVLMSVSASVADSGPMWRRVRRVHRSFIVM